MTGMEKAAQLARDGKAREFYNCRAWRKKAHAIFKRDRYECRRCKERGRYRRAANVHHIKPLLKRPELAFADGNLISLCAACHNEEHGKLAPKPKGPPLTPERW